MQNSTTYLTTSELSDRIKYATTPYLSKCYTASMHLYAIKTRLIITSQNNTQAEDLCSAST